MSAELTAQEPSAKYLVNLQPPLVRHFDLIAQAPGGVARLRELILTLAVQGKLVPQDPSDEPASELLKKIRLEKDRLIAEGKIKRDKPLAEITDEESSIELPDSWTWVRFGDVSINRDGERIPVSSSDRERRSKVYDYYGASGVIDKIDGYLFDKTLLLIGEDGANLINRSTPIAFLAHGKYWVNNHAHVIDATNPQLLDYLALFINSISLRPYVTGTAQPKMNQAKLNSIPVALPPLAEQSRIVTRVEELMQLCDALEAQGQLEAEQHARLVSTLFGSLLQTDTPEALADNWQRIATHFDLLLDRPEAVDALEQTILQLAVQGKLVPQDPSDEPASVLLQKIRIEKDRLIAEGKIKRDKSLTETADEAKPFELPTNWLWCKGRDLFNVIRGVTYQKTDARETPADDHLPLLRANNIQAAINLDDLVYVPKHLVSDDQCLHRGDYLVCLASGSKKLVGKAAPFTQEIDCSFGAFCGAIRPVSNMDFLAIYLSSPLYRETVSAASAGIGINNLKGTSLLALDIPLPPLAEQSRIVTRVNELCALCADLRLRLTDIQNMQAKLAGVVAS